jgi:hypothetical protein
VVLVLIKLVHTAVWAVFAGAILVLPWFIVRRRWRWVGWLLALVAVECVVVAVNGMRCPLTDVAAGYTTDRVDNFDIYLPVWLARRNKVIFGTMYAIELVWAAGGWVRAEIAKRNGDVTASKTDC